VAAFALPDVIALATGRASSMTAVDGVAVLPDRRLRSEKAVVARDELVPYSAARLRRMLGSAVPR
jgi:hypothetical protein